ncbi:MAG: TRAP transporter substrate-binding protein DctP, partial [Candidatus Binatia bacterium]
SKHLRSPFRKKHLKRHLLHVLASRMSAVFLLAVSACERSAAIPSAGHTEIWRIAIEEVPGSVQDTYAQKFKELIEVRTAGAVQVIVYPYGSLGTSDQVTELLHMGAIQFAMASPGHLGKLIPEIQLLLLHFIFSEDNEVNKAVLGKGRPLHDNFATLYRQKGLRLLALYPEGWQVWTTKKPIRHLDDFRGLKMRVMTSPLLIEAYKAYGANPTPLPYGEVYSALQLNMIDGQVNPLFAIEEMSFYEVAEYMTFAKHAQFITSVVMNPQFFRSLSSEKQRLLDNVIADLHDYIFTVQKTFNAERLEKMKARKPGLHLQYLLEEERERFKKASLAARQKYIELVGPTGAELLQQLLDDVAAAEAQRHFALGNTAGLSSSTLTLQP